MVRERSPTFDDHWSQPRLFYNSIKPVEQQFLIDAIRFETAHLHPDVQKNVLTQLNKISHDIAVRVGEVLGLEAPAADSTYYHNNTTIGLSIFGEKLPTIATLRVGVLASIKSQGSLAQGKAIKEEFVKDRVSVIIVGETLGAGVDMTYSAAEAVGFDGIIVADGASALFDNKMRSSLYPPGRPTQIVTDGYNWGKPLGFLGDATLALKAASASKGPGVYEGKDIQAIVTNLRDGLAQFKFTDRFALDK